MKIVHEWLPRILSLPQIIENSRQFVLLRTGVCKTRTGYLRMADADGKMRIEKCGWKKMRITKKLRRKKKREMRITKKNK